MKAAYTISLILILLATSLISCDNTSTSQNKEFKKGINNLSTYTLDQIKGIPSLSIAVIKGDEVVHIGSYGLADVEHSIKVTTKTPYYIASTTKSFNGTLAQILHDEKLLDLDASITTYEPIKSFENKTLFEGISIRELLTHTSGISNGYLVWRNAVSGQYTHQQLIEILESQTTDLGNDKAFKYDNLGYNIFDLILQEELGLDWKQLLKEKIFNPLEMEKTTASYDKVIKENWKPTQPYICIGDSTRPVKANSRKDEKTMQAAGGLFASIKDIANWLIFNVNNGSFKDKVIYEPQVLKQVLNSYAEVNDKGTIFTEVGYGLGWHVSKYKDQKVLYHNGGFLGNTAKISFMPDQKIGVAVFSNESFFGDNIADLLTAYTYDFYLDSLESYEAYLEQIKDYGKRINKMNRSYASSVAERAGRQSSLTLSPSQYVGKFSNQAFGDFSITVENDIINISMGLLSSRAYYGKDANTLEVEFSGPGSKQLIEFIITNDMLISLKFKGLEFVKINPE
ncbi:serine hydrolase domain-containing protein [Fulvivirga lutimaris]|uniref:serine hydrolase domain-containing protein n=1 Tax=Fulvivirga lutimaris TaxID=1819566 RepID=UPI0012BB84BA|nr:serine hydrolase domain-containing protein [Fulvivirga lutimaris]MTI38535.1 class A beta-lactamase-related serine hydrolase [Fulvivirga lutimaris]